MPPIDSSLAARYKAVTAHLRWNSIPAVIRAGLSDEQARFFNFRENLERKNLTVVEESLWLARNFPPTAPLREIAQTVKRDTRWVHQRLRLAKMPELVQQMAAAGELSLSDIDRLAKVDPAEQIAMAKRLARSKVEQGDPLPRGFRPRKRKADINAMIERLLHAGHSGLAPRCLAWAAGYITDEELLAEI